MAPRDWPRPLTLLTTLLSVEEGGAAAAGLIRTMSGQDWEAFTKLAVGQHRVATSVARRLEAHDIPPATRAGIEAAVQHNRLVVMAQMAETRRIRKAMDAIGVELAVFKGWPLAERLYGQADARHTGDLDLLVPEHRVAECRLALESIGFQVAAHTAKFRTRLRGLDSPQLIRACKDIEMMRPESGVVVEMHWRFLNYHAWPLLYDRPGAMEMQRTAAGPLLVPDSRTNLLYLSTHGALHLWDQLKWLEDIARLAKARGPEQLAEDVEIARETGLARPVIFALSLAGQLLASPIPPGLDHADRRTGGLVDWMLRRLTQNGGRFSRKRYQAGIRWMGLKLAKDWRQAQGIIGYDTTRRLRLAALSLARYPSPSKKDR